MLYEEDTVAGIGYVDVEVKIVDNLARQKPGVSGPISAKVHAAERDEVIESLAPLDLEKLYQAAQTPSYWSQDLASFYGSLLYEWLFGGRLREELLAARSFAQSLGRPIRFRLTIDESLGIIRGLRWESLFSKKDEEFLSQSMIFSRVKHGRSRQSWPVVERPLRLRTIIANRSGSPTLPPNDLQRLEESLTRNVRLTKGELLTTQLSSYDSPEPENQRPAHIVALVGRAELGSDQQQLTIQGILGDSTIPLREVAERLVPREKPPFMVFLATPTLGDPRASTSFVSLAEEFINREVQAVIAVQGPMALDRLAEFSGAFLDAVSRNGEIDSAVRVARSRFAGAHRGEWDWTFPVLTLRSPNARLYQPLSEAFEAALPSY